MTTALRCTQALHNSLAADATSFARLELIGYQVREADGDDPAAVLEVRACACGSTISRPVGGDPEALTAGGAR